MEVLELKLKEEIIKIENNSLNLMIRLIIQIEKEFRRTFEMKLSKKVWNNKITEIPA